MRFFGDLPKWARFRFSFLSAQIHSIQHAYRGTELLPSRRRRRGGGPHGDVPRAQLRRVALAQRHVERVGGAARGVRLAQELCGRLAKVEDLVLEGRALELVLDAVEVDGALVAHVREDVERALGGVAALLVAKDEVDPLVQVRAHVVALERRAQRAHKGARAAVRPRRQHRSDRAAYPAGERSARRRQADAVSGRVSSGKSGSQPTAHPALG